MPKTNEQTRKEMREQLSRWWAHKKVKMASALAIALTILLTTWWTGFIDESLWPHERVMLSIENVLWAPPPRPEDRFRVALSWLENDKSGDDTQIVEQAFRSVSGIELVRSARSIRASGAADDWQPAMQEGAAEVLEAWDADLAIVGLVKQSQQVLSLWFIPRMGEGTLDRGDLPYKLEDVTLGEDFHDDLDAQLVAVTLASMSITEDTDEMLGRALDRGLREARRNLVALLRSSAIDQPERRARLQEVIGIVLLRLGELDGGTEYPEEAVSVYRASLNELSRERVPLEWARMQYYLGTALYSLGTALSILGELEGGTERLEEAVEAYRAALEEFTRERTPFFWAGIQNNLGGVFQQLGEREGGTERLEEAEEAYRAALEEFTRERSPRQWASKQNNLGTVLRSLGNREGDTERLEEAVEAYRAAFEELSRAQAPLEWALTQNNLAVALSDLGRLEGNTERLEEAVEAHRAALEERTRDRRPLQWARTQNNLGGALSDLGRLEGNTERLEEAVEAHRAALEEFTRERSPLQWAEIQNNLGRALWILGRVGGRHRALRRGGEGPRVSTGGIHARVGAARVGQDAEPARHCLYAHVRGAGRH